MFEQVLSLSFTDSVQVQVLRMSIKSNAYEYGLSEKFKYNV
jgi:hypothetical protein